MDIVRPETDERLPAIIWLHGGAWRSQDRRARPDLARHFAADGFVMVSIDYRLTPQTRYPGQLYDVRRAVRFLREQADEFGIDTDAIGAFGSSAGGHLAALTAAHSHTPALPGEDRSDYSSAIQAAVDGYGASDLVRLATLQSPVSPEDSPEAQLIGGPVADNLLIAMEASPALQVGPLTPPMMILHGRDDALMPLEQSLLLYKALLGAGRYALLYNIEGFGHGFLNPGDVQELGPGHILDTGRLEAQPTAPALTLASTPEGHQFLERFPSASFGAIAAFFINHLKQRSVA